MESQQKSGIPVTIDTLSSISFETDDDHLTIKKSTGKWAKIWRVVFLCSSENIDMV